MQASAGLISLDDAVASLRVYYPSDTSAITSVNFSSGSNRTLFGFTLAPTTLRGTEDFVVFIEANNG